MDSVQNFLNVDWTEAARANPDFTEHKQHELKKSMNQCAEDTGFDLEARDAESEHFPYFAMCMRGQVVLNPALNQCKAVRQLVNGWTF